jgi:hypothetical protein
MVANRIGAQGINRSSGAWKPPTARTWLLASSTSIVPQAEPVVYIDHVMKYWNWESMRLKLQGEMRQEEEFWI